MDAYNDALFVLVLQTAVGGRFQEELDGTFEETDMGSRQQQKSRQHKQMMRRQRLFYEDGNQELK